MAKSTYRGSGRLEGLATVVTGADSGIGKAVALAFAREGADVVVAYLSEHPDAAGTVRLVEDAGRRAVPFAGDLRDEATCQRLVDLARRELGGVDVLVNNAAFQRRRDRIEDIPTEEWNETLQTNLSAMFWLCRATVPDMRPGASIINTASIQAVHPSANLLAYATTKGGIVTFSKAPRRAAGGAGHPRQRRRARAGLDAARGRHDAARRQCQLRRRHAARPARAARGARARVRLPGVAGVRLRHGAGPGGDRRRTVRVGDGSRYETDNEPHHHPGGAGLGPCPSAVRLSSGAR